MIQVTLRFKTEDEDLPRELVTAWLEDEGITLHYGGGKTATVDLTYVKEMDR